MGLDMYAYTATKPDADHETGQRELAYWRKHANLHGWMERLWEHKVLADGGDPESHTFNGIEVELTWEDLDELERDIKSCKLPETRGFFFGDGADDHYRDADLNFIRKARAELFLGLRVFYNSSW